MKLREEIEKYIPYNEQETADKEAILQFMDAYGENVLTRDNKIGHFTTSAWIVNKERTKVLMIYHNIYQSWAWIGGHADGIEDLQEVIRREIEEESGVTKIKPLTDGIYSICIATVDPHIKRGKYVNSHLHLDVEYLFEAHEKEEVRIKEDENSGVKWVPIEDATKITKEEKMKPMYQKLNEKLKKIK